MKGEKTNLKGEKTNLKGEKTNLKGEKTKSAAGMGRYLSVLAAWGLSVGYAVGWGAFVMPGTSFLPGAGPLGTLLGFLIGGAVMAVIAWNYHTLVSRWPCSGGAFCIAGKRLAARVFEASHELKGVYASLGLTPLYDVCSEIVEIARAGGLDGVADLLPSLEEMHAEIVNLAKREKPPSEDLV